MSVPQTLTFWLTAISYTVATMAVFSAVGLRKQGALSVTFVSSWVGLVMHAAALGVRWWESGHFPYVGNYEGMLFGTFLVAGGYVGMCTWRRDLVTAGVVALPATLVTMGWGVTQASMESVVSVVYQSVWLLVHFTFAWVTYAVYLIAASVSVGLLVRERAARKNRPEPAMSAWMPDSKRLDDLALRMVAFGFLNNAITLASGSIWAYRLWGSYWSWDPVETWTLATWIAYGFYLHAKLTLGWDRRTLAWVAIIALFGVSMATWGVQLVPDSYHLFRNLGGTMMQSRPQ